MAKYCGWYCAFGERSSNEDELVSGDTAVDVHTGTTVIDPTARINTELPCANVIHITKM